MIVKSAHRAEIARWVQTIRLNIEHYSQEDESTARTGELLEARSVPKRALSMHSATSERPKATVAALPPVDHFVNTQLQQSAQSLSGLSAPVTIRSKGDSAISMNQTDDGGEAETMSIFEATDKDSLVGDDEQRPASYGIPHEASFDLGVLNIKAQVELALQLVDSIVTSPSAAAGSPGRGVEMQRISSGQQAIKDALRSSLHTLALQVSQQSAMSQDREQYLLGRIQREIQARKLWEENMLAVAEQQAEMDRQLTEAARDNDKKRRALRQARGVLAGLGGGSLPNSPAPEVPGSATTNMSGILDTTPGPPSTAATLPTSPGTSYPEGSIPNIQEAHNAVVAAGAESDDEDDDDQFFDAIEQNTLPNLRLYDSIARPDEHRPGTPSRRGSLVSAADRKEEGSADTGAGTIKDLLARKSLEPYNHVRQRLPIDDDKRPSVSLWSILKSSVGKDLTKISFPVSFNECTSMLQRMTEDMEYDACLTVAAGEEDSTKRIAFVAAFAMSNYSSTIGRIAKPFNPLLSQSFEYAIPNRYRYISEQVSHHPVSFSEIERYCANLSQSPHAIAKLQLGSTSVKSMRRTSFKEEVSKSGRLVWHIPS